MDCATLSRPGSISRRNPTGDLPSARRAVSLQRDELVEETRSGFFAEDDAPLSAELDLEDRAGVNAERVADLLRQGELAFGGDGGFHGLTVK